MLFRLPLCRRGCEGNTGKKNVLRKNTREGEEKIAKQSI